MLLAATYIVVGVILAVIGDMGLKSGTKSGYILGIVTYAASSYPIFLAYRAKDDFGMIGVLWQSFMALAFISLSVVFYREQLTPKRVLIFALTLVIMALMSTET